MAGYKWKQVNTVNDCNCLRGGGRGGDESVGVFEPGHEPMKLIKNSTTNQNKHSYKVHNNQVYCRRCVYVCAGAIRGGGGGGGGRIKVESW